MGELGRRSPAIGKASVLGEELAGEEEEVSGKGVKMNYING